VCETTVVQDAWARGQTVVVHGWVYGLHDGLLHDLEMTVRNATEVEPAYARALVAVKARLS
jgi:carbonic anhydrase